MTPEQLSRRQQVKEIFDNFTPFLFDGEYDYIMKKLDVLDVDILSSQNLVSYLSVTNPWKEYLNPVRSNFLLKVEKKLLKEVGLERTEKILIGLR